MRILLLNYEYPPLGGGAGNAAQYLVRELSTQPQITVDVVTSSVDTYSQEQYADRITIHRLDIHKGGKNIYHQSLFNLLTFSWKSYWYIRQLRKQHHYDGVHAFFGMPCGLIAATHGLPFIVSLRGSDVPFYNPRFYLLDLLFSRVVSKWIWKRARAVTPNSFHLQRLAQRVAPHQPMRVIPNGVDTDMFQSSTAVHNPITILCVARLVRRKYVRSLIEAAALLSEERTDFKVVIVGDGEEQEGLECMTNKLHLEQVVRLVGAVTHDDVAAYYQHADVFVLPSLNEGMSNALLEALSSGLVMVSTPTGDAATVIDESNGIIVPFMDSQAIATALIQLLNAPERIPAMKQRSREKSLALTWESVADAFLSVYTSSFTPRV